VASPLANPQQHYLKTQIETASQPQLLLMIFDAAVKKLHMAKRAIEKKEIEKAHTELTKVQRIFTELMVALDFEKGGDLAENLLRIYDFVYHHLVKANIKQDAKMVDEVLPIVEDLRDGWTKAVEKFLHEQEDSGVQPAPRAGVVASAAEAPKAPVLPKIPTPLPKVPAYAKPAVVAPPAGETPPQRPRLNIRG
jgi:flagellar secretion chaperone FliS